MIFFFIGLAWSVSDIRTPEVDVRKYKNIFLPNGLEVVLVQDSLASKETMAMSVQVGSFEDPLEWEGMAHFCEHMLFLGSKKYPYKTTFSEHLAQYAGEHNAYTSHDFTAYFNSLSPEGYVKGLDIFSQFFINPLFDLGAAQKEREVIHSEYIMFTAQTITRENRLMASLAYDRNPVSRFNIGTRESLRDRPGQSVADKLREFYNTYYVSSRMRLALVANRTLDELQQLAETYFKDIQGKPARIPRPTYYDPPAYPANHLGKRVKSRGSYEMILTFPLPSELYTKYRENIDAILNRIFSNVNEKSLQRVLRLQQLISSMSVGIMATPAGSELKAVITMTEFGAKDPDNIIAHFLAYVEKIRQSQLEDMVRSYQQYSNAAFKWAERESSENDFGSALAVGLAMVAFKDLLTSGTTIDVIDMSLLKRTLEGLRAHNMNVGIFLPDFDESKGKFTEKWFGIGYDREEFSKADFLQLEKRVAELLPEYNVMFPLKHLPGITPTLVTASTKGNPQMLSPGVWWHGSSQRGDLPKIKIQGYLMWPKKEPETPLHTLFHSMYAYFVEHQLEVPTYDLISCGMSFSVSRSLEGLSFAFSGFDEHMDKLIAKALPVIRKPDVERERFEKLKQIKYTRLNDRSGTPAHSTARKALSVIADTNAYSVEDYNSVRDDLTYEAFVAYLKKATPGTTLTTFFLGNVDQARATKFAGSMATMTDSKLGEPRPSHHRILNVKDSIEVRFANPAPNDANHAIVNVYQFPTVSNISTRVHMMFLSEIISDPFFNFLRTEHKLGYIVHADMASRDPLLEMHVVIQGSHERPDKMDPLINDAMKVVEKSIGKVAKTEDFQRRQRVLVRELERPNMNAGEEVAEFWPQIQNSLHCFKDRENKLHYLKTMEPGALLQTWNTLTRSSNSKISIKVYGGMDAVPSPKICYGSLDQVVAFVVLMLVVLLVLLRMVVAKPSLQEDCKDCGGSTNWSMNLAIQILLVLGILAAGAFLVYYSISVYSCPNDANHYDYVLIGEPSARSIQQVYSNPNTMYYVNKDYCDAPETGPSLAHVSLRSASDGHERPQVGVRDGPVKSRKN